MCVRLNPLRDHLVQLEKHNPALDWEHTATPGAGIIQTRLGKEQMNFLYVTILTPNYKIRVLWLVPKVKIEWFRTLFISTGCGITSFLDKLDILPGSRLFTGAKRSLLAETTWLAFCHGMKGSQSSQTGGGFPSQITCWPLKFQKTGETQWYKLTRKQWKPKFLT